VIRYTSFLSRDQEVTNDFRWVKRHYSYYNIVVTSLTHNEVIVFLGSRVCSVIIVVLLSHTIMIVTYSYYYHVTRRSRMRFRREISRYFATIL